MKKSILIAVLAATTIFSTSCSKDDESESTPITIESTLATSKQAYQDATNGNWVEITKEEYDNLASNLNDVNKVGTKDENYQTTSSNIRTSGRDFTIAHDNGATIPKDSYLFAFKFINNSDDNSINIKTSSSNVKTGFTNTGNAISSIDKGEHFYVLKGNTKKLDAESFLAYYFVRGVGYDSSSNGNSKYSFESGDRSALSDYTANGVYFIYQGLSSTQKQW